MEHYKLNMNAFIEESIIEIIICFERIQRHYGLGIGKNNIPSGKIAVYVKRRHVGLLAQRKFAHISSVHFIKKMETSVTKLDISHGRLYR